MDVGRALLFVPGDRPDRIVKALTGEADSVAVDFEDAVAADAKDAARERAAEVLTGRQDRPRPAVHVRINALGTDAAEADLAALPRLLPGAGLAGLIVPKADSPEDLERLDEQLTTAERAAGTAPGRLSLVPIIETARGVLSAADVAGATPRIGTLLFGALDLAAELGVRPTVEGRELLHARSQVVLATRAAGLPGPVDGPYPALDDDDGLVRSSAAGRALGFTGRVVLHPRQVAPVRQVFAPTAGELRHARKVLAAYEDARRRGVGALRLPDGTFVDRPVVARASALLRSAGAEAGVPG